VGRIARACGFCDDTALAHLDMNRIVGSHDIVLLTLDTLRYDVAIDLWQRGRTPNLAALLPRAGWQKRHAPGSFTYSSHHAMFAGFLPTPCEPGPHPRLFAMAFEGSESIASETCVFDSATLVEGLGNAGYHTLCVGGTGFFNKSTPLGKVLPGLFAESHWDRSLGVTDADSTKNQFRVVASSLARLDDDQRAFVFVNIAALHQPNYFYCEGRSKEDGDDLRSHAAALEYVDTQLPALLETLQSRGPSLVILCSDHGTAYGEQGHTGHRIAHEVVWTVPYAEAIVPRASESTR
tara:strand:+ start:39335 stop:40213 length:879 start_codon:yes stop_codon:yes gene_type:complete